MFDKEVVLPTLDLWIALRLLNLILFLSNSTNLLDDYYTDCCAFTELGFHASVILCGAFHMCLDIAVLVVEWTFNQLFYCYKMHT
jgi:hypothetical protein